MRVLICGGRDYSDRETLFRVLDAFAAQRGPFSCLIHGNAPGADTLAGKWAMARGIHVKAYAAEWEKFGKAAGPIRNKRMLDHAFPDLVIVFPGGRGTANMIEQATRYGVEVVRAAPAHPKEK